MKHQHHRDPPRRGFTTTGNVSFDTFSPAHSVYNRKQELGDACTESLACLLWYVVKKKHLTQQKHTFCFKVVSSTAGPVFH